MDPMYVLLKTENDELRACRVCLGTEDKLYNLHENSLLETFSNFAGVPAAATDGLPQQLCGSCHNALRRSAAFRDHCRRTHHYLKTFVLPLTSEVLRNLDTTHLKFGNETQLDLVNEKEDLISEIKEEVTEIEPSTESDKNNFEVHFLNDKVEDEQPMDFDYNDTDSPDELLIEISKNKSKEKLLLEAETVEKKAKKNNLSKRKHQTLVKERKSLRKRLKKDSKEAEDNHKKLLYDIGIDKYVGNSKVNSNTDVDILDLDENKDSIDVIDYNNASTNEGQHTENDLDTKVVYEYENHKSKRTPVKRKRETKVKSKPKSVKKDKRYKDEDDMVAFAKTYNFDLVFLNTKEEQYAELVVRKQSLKYKKGKYRCEYCFFGFQTENVFKNHMTVHDLCSGDNACEVCHTRFQRHTELLEHQRRHHLYKYTCRECGKCVPYSSLAKQHYEFHKGIKYECEHCGKKYSKYSSRLDHIRIHHATTVCEICYETFQGPLGLRSHKTKVHKETALCGGCNKHFDSKAALQRHAEPHGCDPRTVPCTKCGLNFPLAGALADHIAASHTKHKVGDDTGYKMKKRVVRNKVVYCDCPADARPDGGAEALPVDPDSRCERCGCLRKKRKPKKFLCEICADRMFTSEAALKYHQRIHTGERPYQCPMCPKRFRVKENLHNHVNTHTGERPYACPHCPKAFRTNTANHRHQLVHTKKRPYHCEICAKSFQTSTYLKLHVRTVHMKIPMPPRARARKRHE